MADERVESLTLRIQRVIAGYGVGDLAARNAADEIVAIVPPPHVIANLAQAALNVVYGWKDNPRAVDEALIYEGNAEPLISYGDLRELLRAIEAYGKHRHDAIN